MCREMILLIYFFTAEGFDDRETVIDGIFVEVDCQVMKPALF